MNGRFILRVLLTLVVVAAIVGLGAYIYNAGMAQGLAQSAQVTGRESGAAPIPYTGPYVRPFFGFGCFGLLIPLFLMFLLFGAMRVLFWRGAWGRGRMHHGAWGMPPMAGKWDPSKGAQAMFEEWHRHMHESHEGETSPASDQPAGKVQG